MSKKNRKKKKVFEEVINAGNLRVAKQGNQLKFSNTATPEEQEKFIKTTEEAHLKIQEQLAKEVGELQDLISQYDPVELMHRATYMILPLFMKYESEGQFGVDESFFLPTVEYIQYLISRTEPNTSGKKISEKEWELFWEKAFGVVRLTQQWLFTRRPISRSISEIDHLIFHLDHKRLFIRGDRYPSLIKEYWETSLLPYNQWIQDVYGITAPQLIKGLEEIAEYLKTGTLGRYREFMEADALLGIKLKEKGFTQDHIPTDEEKEALLESEELKPFFEDTQEKARMAFTPAIFDITEVTSLPKSILSLFSVRPGESVFRDPALTNHDDLSPLSNSVLHFKPFLEVNGRFYCCYHSGFEDKIMEIIEDDLSSKRPQSIPKMEKSKSDQIEKESKDLLVKILNPDKVEQNIYYPNPDRNGDLTEVDILMELDDLLFIVEVKAGGLSPSASRGASKSLAKDISDIIIKGQQQSERAERYIKSKDSVEFYDETGKNVVCTIKQKDYRKIFRIVVTRESLGWVGAQIAILSVLDANLSKSYPWHVSLDDLRIISKLFEGKDANFIHFLEKRLLASSDKRLVQVDEIDHVGLYFSRNNYHPYDEDADIITFDSSFMREIDLYFSSKYKGEEKVLPGQKIPEKLTEFIDALRSSKLKHRYEVTSLVLDNSEAGRDDLVKAFNQFEEARVRGKRLSARMPYSSLGVGITITYTGSQFLEEEYLRSAAQMKQSNLPRWIVVKMKDSSDLVVEEIRILTNETYSDDDLRQVKNLLEDNVKKLITQSKPGRNEKCPCGSGKKFKKCHGY